MVFGGQFRRDVREGDLVSVLVRGEDPRCILGIFLGTVAVDAPGDEGAWVNHMVLSSDRSLVDRVRWQDVESGLIMARFSSVVG